jgi:hypothetical protein
MVADEKGDAKVMDMPKESYMMHKEKDGQEGCFLLISPWKFAGMGAKSEKEEYWVLGAQFLQNYYSIYDFKDHKIGLVESVTSRMIGQKPSATQTSTPTPEAVAAIEANAAAIGEEYEGESLA